MSGQIHPTELGSGGTATDMNLIEGLRSIHFGTGIFTPASPQQLKERMALVEGTSQAYKLYVATGKIPEPIFNHLVGCDPTQQKKYIEWICKIFLAKSETGMIGRMKDALRDFDEMANKNILKGEQKDIQRYKTLESLVDVVIQNKDVKTATQAKKDIKQEGVDHVFENDKCTVYRIHTQDASMLFGAGTKWCTAASKSYNYFSSYYYDRKVNLYYIIPKGELLETIGKLAMAVYPDNRRESYDAMDKTINMKKYADILGFPYDDTKKKA